MPDPIEVPLPPEAEGQPQEAIEAPPEQQPQEEFVNARYRGEEVPLPSAAVDVLAQALKTTREGAVNWVQRNMDANRAWNEAERFRQQSDAYYQELESLRQRGGQQPQQPPPYQPPYAPPPQYPQQPVQGAEDDPISLLKLTARQIQQLTQNQDQMRQDWQRERDRMKAEYEERQTTEEQARVMAYGEEFVTEKNKTRKNPIPLRDLLEEVQISGLHRSGLPWERIFDKAYRVLTYEEAGETAQQNLMQRLRAPDARVIIPGAPASQPAPKDNRSEAEKAIGDMKWGQAVEFIPEARR
jgi:hypothetical protein